jgi:hypothetical protein
MGYKATLIIKGLFMLLVLHTCSAEQDYLVKKIWLFSQTVYNGNVSKSPNGGHGKGNSKKMLCYVEVFSDKPMPQWQTAIIYGQQYAVQVVPVNQDSVAVGVLKKTNSPVVIKAGTGSKLVQLVLTNPVKTENTSAWPVILSGGTPHGTTAYTWSKEPVVELADEMMP